MNCRCRSGDGGDELCDAGDGVTRLSARSRHHSMAAW